MELFTFDDEYVRRLRERDRDTTDHFVSYFGELLLIKLRRRLPSAEAIEDVCQEVLYRVLAKLDELRDGRKLGAFVNATCELVLKEYYRDEARQRRPEALQPVEEWRNNPLRDVIDAETRKRILDVLGKLKPPRDAEILRELFLNEKTKDEVCEQFGVSRENLRVVVHRALKRFRGLFEPDDDDPPVPV